MNVMPLLLPFLDLAREMIIAMFAHMPAYPHVMS